MAWLNNLRPSDILCSFVDTDEMVIQSGTHELLMDEDPVIVKLCQDWITARELDRGTYAADLLTNNTLVDGLFLVLAIAWADKHEAVIHSEGMWSLRVDSSRWDEDLLLALTPTGFCQVLCHSEKTHPMLCDPPTGGTGWNMSPPVIWARIKDVEEALANTNYEQKPDAVPDQLINVLSDFFGMRLHEYRDTLIHWMEDNMLEHPVAVNWWHTHNQDWPYYLTVLQSNLTPDGLELWCACAASGTYLTFIQ